QSILGDYTVSGMTTMRGGAVEFLNAVTLPQLTLNGGTLRGPSTVHLPGPFTWTSGMMEGAGHTIIENTSVATWTGPADKSLGRILENMGNIAWDGGRL